MIRRLLCAFGIHDETYQMVDVDGFTILRLRCSSCDWHSPGLVTPARKWRGL